MKFLLKGVVFPAMHELWSHWAPPLERTKLMTSTELANLPVNNWTSNFINSLTFRQSNRYVHDHGHLWTVGWISWLAIDLLHIWFLCFALVRHLVLLRSRKSFRRRKHQSRRTQLHRQQHRPYSTSESNPHVTSNFWSKIFTEIQFFHAPWRSILTSKPIWAAMTAHMVQNCGFYTFLTQLPTFLNDVSGWNLGKTGIVAAVPYLIMAVVLQFAGQLADLLRSRFKIRTTLVINLNDAITIYFLRSK